MLRKIFHRVESFFRNKRLQYVLDKRFLSNLSKLEFLLGFKIFNQTVYLKALTHRSYLELHPELEKSNERLEFLGDAVLSMTVAEYLFKEFKKADEGFLTKSRASMVNRFRLFQAAEEFGLKEFILFNEKYLRGSHEGFQTIMADCLEALIGAIYLDHGLTDAANFVREYIISPFQENDSFIEDKNYKGQLLEFTHSQKLSPPRYVVVKEEGPSHLKRFIIETYLGDELVGVGEGKNKKMAEQDSSKNALHKLKYKK